MGSVININSQSYREHKATENWSGEYVKHIMKEHKTAIVLDHPDGCVTEEKLSDSIKEKISEATEAAQTATEKAEYADQLAREATSKVQEACDTAVGAENTVNEHSANSDIHISEQDKTNIDRAMSTATTAKGLANTAIQNANQIGLGLTTVEIFMQLRTIQIWYPNTLYKEGQHVYVSAKYTPAGVDKLYKCTTKHTSNSDFSPEYWEECDYIYVERAQHANNADNAESDSAGNDIISTYATKSEVAETQEMWETHTNNLGAHISDSERAEWGANTILVQEALQKAETAQDGIDELLIGSIQYWKHDTWYKVGQIVQGPYYFYKCLRTHKSSQSSTYENTEYWSRLREVVADVARFANSTSEAIYAYTAEHDIKENNIIETYATKAELADKADKSTIITDTESTSYTFDFSDMYNSEMRLQAASTISIIFVDNEYAEDYISGLSFQSGETPTAIDYTDSGILNWVGTDCTTSDGLSIFQPSANTHYDIVFYFNGVQFIGLVNGFVPATGNEAV